MTSVHDALGVAQITKRTKPAQSVHPVFADRLEQVRRRRGPADCPDCSAGVQPVGVHELPTQCIECDPTARPLLERRAKDQRAALEHVAKDRR